MSENGVLLNEFKTRLGILTHQPLNQFVEAENILMQFDGIAKDDPFGEKISKVRRKMEKAKAKHDKQKQRELQDRKQSAPSTP